MSLENTLREMLNEMKMPPYKVGTNPTMKEKPLPPREHTGPQKPSVPSHTGSQQKPRKPSEITRSPRRLEETLVEYYKQRLHEAIPLDDLRGAFGDPNRPRKPAKPAGETPTKKPEKPKEPEKPKGGGDTPPGAGGTRPPVDLNALRDAQRKP